MKQINELSSVLMGISARVCAFLAVALAGLAAVAGVKTWSPSVADGGVYKWNNAANWAESAVPENGDSLVFDSSAAAIEAVNDIANLQVAGMAFSGANDITLSGSKIVVAANGAFSANGPAAITLALPMDISGMTTFSSLKGDAESGATFNFTGEIGGAGGIATGGDWSGMYNFRAANIYEGRTYLTNGVAFHVYNGGAFGSASSDTYYSIRGYPNSIASNAEIAPLYFHGVTIDEPFKVWGYQSKSLVFPSGTTNVLNGDIYSIDVGNVERWFVEKKACLVCNGVVDLTSTAQLNVGDYSELVFSNKVVLSRASNGVRNTPSANGGIIRYAGEIDIGNANFIVYSTGRSILDRADIFGAAGGKVTYNYNGIVEVRGGHQYLKTITGNSYTTAIFTSNEGTEVELLNSGSNYAGKFTGSVKINIAAGAKYTAAGQSVPCLMTNGVQVTRFLSYGASGSDADVKDDNHFAGTGKFIASGVQYKTWIGPAAGGSLDADENWSPLGSPVVGDYVTITGCTAGATFTNAQAGRQIGGLTLSGAGAILFSGATLALTNGAIVAVDGAAPAVTFDLPLELQGTGSVTLKAAAANSVLYFPAVISGTAPLVTSGPGTVHFSGDNTFTGDFTIRNKEFYVESNGAFGGTAGKTTLYRRDYPGVQRICFMGVTNAETFVVNGEGSTRHCIMSGANVFNGEWSRTNEQMRFGLCNNSYTEFTHDFGDVNYLTVDPEDSNTSGAVMVFNAAFTAGQPRFGGGAMYIFKKTVTMSRNTTTYGFTYNLNGGTIRLDGDYVLNRGNKCPTISIKNSCVNGTVDLYGHDEEVANVSGNPSAGGSVTITSSTGPATLHVLNNLNAVLNNGVYAGRFSGELSVSVEGNSALDALTLSGASDSTGTLTATNGGKVVMLSGASWAGDVRIETGSRVEVASSSAFSETTHVTVANGGVLKITTGALTVASLKLGDLDGAIGTSYGPVGSGADVETSMLEGAGTIRVERPADRTVRTWCGPAGGSWSTAANWSPAGAPQDLDTVVFDASIAAVSSVNDIPGLTLGGISFAGGNAIALSGVAVSLEDGGRLAASSCNAEITLGLTLSVPNGSMAAIAATSNTAGAVTWNLTAPFSGAGDVHFAGDHSATVNFRADSPSFDGVLYLTNAAAYHVWTDGAFGSTVGHTFHGVVRGNNIVNVEKFISPIWFHGVTTHENFLVRGLTSFDLCFDHGTTNVFNGAIDAIVSPNNGNAVTERWWLGTNSVARFNGPVGMQSLNESGPFTYLIMFGRPGARAEFNNACNGNRLRQRMENGGTLAINHPLDPGNSYLGTYWAGAIAFGCENALYADPTKPVRIMYGTSNANRIDLAGFDQTFGRMEEEYSNGEMGYTTFTNSGERATMTLVMANDFTFTAPLSGDLGLRLASNVVVTLDAPLSATGPISLTNGATLAFATTRRSRWAGTEASVAGGSRLVLDDVRLASDTSLAIFDGGKVVLAEGVRQSLSSLALDGADQTKLTSYGSSQSPADVKDDVHFEGKGVVYVVGETSDAVRTWNGPSGGSWSVAANWSPAGVPQTGDTLVFDASSAAVHAVNDMALFYARAIELRGGNSIRISGNALGLFDNGGISAEDAATVAIECDLVLRGTQSNLAVDVLPSADSTISFTGAIGGDAHIAVGGTGTVEFKGENTFTGTLTVSNGTFHAYGDAAFGSTAGKTVFRAPSGVACNYVFHDVRTSDPVEWFQNDGGWRGTFAAGTTNAFNGSFTGIGGQPRVTVEANAYLAFSGLVTNMNYCTIYTAVGAVVDILSPFYCSQPRLSGVGSFFVRDRLVQSSDSYSLAFGTYQDNKIYLMQPNVLCLYDSLVSRYGAAVLSIEGGKVDLCGNSQKVSCFVGGPTATLANSGDPATLHVLQTIRGNNTPSLAAVFNGEFRGVVTGPTTLSIEGGPDPVPYIMGNGVAELVPTQWLKGASTATGALIATNSAIVALVDGGRWAGTNIVVHAGSKILLDSGRALAHVADVYLESDGKLVLEEGVEQRCRFLYINGVKQPRGRYGSGEAGSPAVNFTDSTHFEGRGVFHSSGNGGTVFNLR